MTTADLPESVLRQRAFDAYAARQHFSAVAEAQLLELQLRRWFNTGWAAGVAWAQEHHKEQKEETDDGRLSDSLQPVSGGD